MYFLGVWVTECWNSLCRNWGDLAAFVARGKELY